MQFLKYFTNIIFFINHCCMNLTREKPISRMFVLTRTFFIYFGYQLCLYLHLQVIPLEPKLTLVLKNNSIVLFSLTVYNIIIPGGLALGLVPESPYFLSHRGQSSSKAIQWLMVDPNWINEVEEDISKFLNHRNIDFTPRNPIFNGCYKLV